jgi:hypothetical protein
MKSIYILSILLIASAGATKAQVSITKASYTSNRVISTSKTVFQTSEKGWNWKENSWWRNDTISTGEPEAFSLTDTLKERYVDNVSNLDSCFITTREMTKEYITDDDDWKWNGYIWLHKGIPTNDRPKRFTTKKVDITLRTPVDCKDLELEPDL